MQVLPRHVSFAPAARAALERGARAAYPAEACGLLLGRRQGAELAIAEATLAQNLVVGRAPSAARRAFELDLVDVVRAEDRARACGLELVGVWHSHPDAPPIPSSEDRLPSSTWCQVLVSLDRRSIHALRAFAPDLAELALLLPRATPTGESTLLCP
jgi:proteasome lid subunit RPN8/RPN11